MYCIGTGGVQCSLSRNDGASRTGWTDDGRFRAGLGVQEGCFHPIFVQTSNQASLWVSLR